MKVHGQSMCLSIACQNEIKATYETHAQISKKLFNSQNVTAHGNQRLILRLGINPEWEDVTISDSSDARSSNSRVNMDMKNVYEPNEL